jgi:hypothetical protein
VLVTLPETTPVNELIETAYSLEERVGVQLGPSSSTASTPGRHSTRTTSTHRSRPRPATHARRSAPRREVARLHEPAIASSTSPTSSPRASTPTTSTRSPSVV